MARSAIDGALGDLVRARPAAESRCSHRRGVGVRPEAQADALSQDTGPDIYSSGDPLLGDYPAILAKLRDRIPTTTSPRARDAVGALRLVGVSEHRIWFAAPSVKAREALGTVPGARGALVTAIQAVQKQQVPLYRVVIDPSYRRSRALL